MSVMKNMNSTSNFLFGASEHELLTLSLSEIIDGLMNDYKSFCQGDGAGIRVPDSMQEPRMAHSSILFAEGARLALAYPELGKKLVLASLFDNHERAAFWTLLKLKSKSEDKEKYIINVIRKIAKGEELSGKELLVFVNYFGFSQRAAEWLLSCGEVNVLERLIKDIEEFETFKAAERERKKSELEEEIKALKGQAI